VSYKELHVAVLEDEFTGGPLFKIDGVGAGISEFVHALRMELPKAVERLPRLSDPYSLMKYCLDWVVGIDHLKLFDWKIVYATPEGGYVQLSYCRPGFVQPDEEVYATRFERILNETLV
jgi:hypothetical protein